jgi:peptidyl-prolyl cis-trans isomerase C
MVKNKKLFLVAAAVFLLLFIASCDKAKPLKGNELVRINDRVITLEEFEQEMEKLPPSLKTLMIDEKGRKKFLEDFLNVELLLLEGKKKGLEKDKEVLAKVEMFKRGLIIDTLMGELYKGKDEVSDEEMETYYRENKKQFFLRERVRVRHIVVKTMPEAQEIKRRLDRGEDFITLVRKYSISPSRKEDGDVGYIERGKVGKEFEQAAFALKRQGELSNIVKTILGYHIIRLEDRKQPQNLTFSEVQENISKFLRERKRKEILDAHLQELRKEAQISINEKLLAAEEEKGS